MPEVSGSRTAGRAAPSYATVVVALASAGCISVTQLSAGTAHTCLRYDNGTAACWGENNDGQLGGGPGPDRDYLAMVPGLSGAARVVAGVRHTCAVMNDTTVRCWGRNDNGQLGDGTRDDRARPVEVSGLSGAVDLALGWGHTCARMNDGTVRCWGLNSQGELGDGTTTSRLAPVTVLAVADAVQLVAGFTHSCARFATGQVSCWGTYVTDVVVAYRTSGTPVPQLAGVLDLGATHMGLCALLGGGTITCSRRDADENDLTFDFAAVATIPDAVQLAVGFTHVCARRQTGTVACFGGDDFYQQVGASGTLQGVSEIVAGARHTCVRGGGPVRCWGSNHEGQLGDRSGGRSSGTPVQVAH